MKKSILVILIIMGIFGVYNLLYDTKNANLVKYNDIVLAIGDGNGGTLNSVPDKNPYYVTVNCTNADGSWDYNKWELKLENVRGSVSCDLDFATVSASQNFASYIVSLAGTTQGDGQVVNENGYRYEGANPNNYVWYNDELWRVIGVFDSSRHGTTDTNLVKIIRVETIGSYSWNGVSGYANDWPNSTLYRLLNGCYLNASSETDTTTISGSSAACSTYCVKHYNTTSGNEGARYGSCDFRAIGIHNDGLLLGYRDMIRTVYWYLGGPGASGYTTNYPSEVYGYETNSSAITSGRSTSVSANIGLMYLSDYAYAVLASDCARGSYYLNNTSPSYASSECIENNWLFNGYEWTITPNSGTAGTNARAITYTGYTANTSAYSSQSVRPVVYLKTTTYKVAGTGTATDPYILDYELYNIYNYSSSVQTTTIPKEGYYKLEVYGASGGNANNSTSTSYAGGKGGYAKGVVHLNANDVLYIHTGGAGKGSSSNGIQTGGTNGGGNGGYYRGGSGGGATDIRINTDSLYARVIVAGGGGGAAYRSGYYGGAGGGTSGGDSTGYNTTYNAKGGTSSAGGAAGGYSGYKGTAGSFGQGGAANTISSTTNYGRSGGGGGGWYGGGGGGYRSNSSSYYYGQSGGGGGSSFTYSATTASQVPSGYLLNANYQMTSTSTTAGSNTGSGYARITWCGRTVDECS